MYFKLNNSEKVTLISFRVDILHLQPDDFVVRLEQPFDHTFHSQDDQNVL